MRDKRRDTTRFLVYGFASSLLIGAMLFVLAGIMTISESKRLIAEAGERVPASSDEGPDHKNPGADEDHLEKEAGSHDPAEAPDEQEDEEETASGAADSAQPLQLSYDDGTIRSLSAEEIAAIEQTVDPTLRGFGTGFNEPKDDYNRPVYVKSVEDDMRAAGINGRCFAADENTKQIAITFQAGYENGYTARILDILAEQNVKSTFYITHEYGWNNQDLIRRMIDEGHELGNHSSSAPEEGIALLPLADQMQDAIKLQSDVRETFGYTMRKYNYNSGIFTLASAKMMSEMGYEVVFCSVNYDDFDSTASFDTNEILNSLLSCAHNGCVYCFHMTNEITVNILPGLIHYLRAQGYEIVQLP